MTLTPSPYRGEQDLPALQDLLRSLQADPTLTSVHPGDVEWWFYYYPGFLPAEQSVKLWHTDSGELAAWILLDTSAHFMDLFVHPAFRSADTFDQILAWVDAQYSAHPSEESITCEWCFRSDDLYIAALERAGYTGMPHYALFAQTLDQPLPVPTLPQGFRFLDSLDERYIDSRAQAHYSAFSRARPSKMTPALYRDFMKAPGYDPTLDISIVNERDEVVAFAMVWADAVTGRAEFEPVGTHKEYQRRGLGRAALQEGLRRLQARGLTHASVMTPVADAGNMAFYPSAGFAVVGYNDHYEKVMGKAGASGKD